MLVVDDARINVELLKEVLSRDGHTVLTAADGLEALAIIERDRPEVVLSDVMMPGMDGYELCRAIKAHPATRLTPVVLVTSLQSREERLKGIHAGADDFLTKPFDSVGVDRARALAVTPEAIHRRTRVGRIGDRQPGADRGSARRPIPKATATGSPSYAVTLGRAIGLSPQTNWRRCARGGLLHDVGKVGHPRCGAARRGPRPPTTSINPRSSSTR